MPRARAPWFLEEGFRILLLYICLNFLLRRWTGLTNVFLCSCSQMLGPFWQRETEYIKGSAGGMLISFPLLEEHTVAWKGKQTRMEITFPLCICPMWKQYDEVKGNLQILHRTLSSMMKKYPN